MSFAPHHSRGHPCNDPEEKSKRRRPTTPLRDRLETGPRLPKPPPYPAGNKCFRQPGSAGYMGVSHLKALSSSAGHQDRGYGFVALGPVQWISCFQTLAPG
jgi:hypothetical protein